MQGIGKVLVSVVTVMSLGGCVWKGAYDDQVEINKHLRAVKTEQDIERDGLHADVNALNRAYSGQSLRLTAVEGMVTHITNELKGNQSRMTTLIQDQAQVRSELSKLSLQAAETLSVLRTISEHEQAVSQSLTALSGKVDTLKKPAPVRAAKVAEPRDVQDKGKSEVDQTKEKHVEKGAVQRAMEQQMGLSPAVEGRKPLPETKPVTQASKPTTETKEASQRTAVPLSSEGKISSTPNAGTTASAGDPSMATPVVPTTSSAAPPTISPEMQAAANESSPLVKKPEEVAIASPAPKQTWGQWLGDLIGWKRTVQTAQKSASSLEKKP